MEETLSTAYGSSDAIKSASATNHRHHIGTLSQKAPIANSRITVLVVDDHRVVREGLCALLQASGDMTVVAEAENGRDAVDSVNQAHPDVVLMDFAMPKLNGLGALRKIRDARLKTPVIFLSRYGDDERVRKALEAGACGYILKNSPAADVLNGIREAQKRNYFFSAALKTRLVDMVLQKLAPHSASMPAIPELTEREFEILQLIAEGYANKQIAEELGICKNTVGAHRFALMKKLSIHNIAGLTRHAVEQRIIPTEGENDFQITAG